MPKTEKTLVTIATYNEIGNLPTLVDEVFRYLDGAEILVVDDNSPDGTGRWYARRAAEDSRVYCIHREGKLGLGSATVMAMGYAIEQKHRYMLNMDADFSHPLQCLPDLVAGMDPPEGPRVDVMIGSRYVAGGRIEGWPLLRQVMSRGINLYARWVLGLPVRDCSSAFRCYRVEVLSHLDFDRIVSRGYSFQEEILWRLEQLGACFGETPIAFLERQQGASKINAMEVLAASGIMLRLGILDLLDSVVPSYASRVRRRSIKLISYQIDGEVHRRLGNRQDGKPVDRD
jgi:dolichol-phosphate mannosyltransferase